MFRHLLKYSAKTYFYNTSNIMWNFIFPFVFITIFFIAMSRLSDPAAEFDKNPIPVAIIAEDQQEADKLAGFLDSFGKEAVYTDGKLQVNPKTESASENSSNAKNNEITKKVENANNAEDTKDADNTDNIDNNIFFHYIKTEDDMAKKMLDDGAVQAIIKADNPVLIDGFNELSEVKSSLLKQFLESYESVRKTITSISDRYKDEMFSDQEKMIEQIKLDIESKHQEKIDLFADDSKQGEKSTSTALIFFFAGIAYIAFYPVNSGVTTLEEITANQSKVGIRNSSTPVSKTKMFFALLIPRWIIHCVFTLIIYFYVGMLGINLGHQHLLIALLLILGTTCSVLTGTAIGALFSFSSGLKIGISIALPLVFGSASGMMFNGMPRIIAEHVPWLNKINPISIVSNGLYMLYADPALERFYKQIIMLLVIILVTFILTIIGLRRNSYESV